MTAHNFDQLISEIRSAAAANDYAALVALLDTAPDERADDMAVFYPPARPVWWILEHLRVGEIEDAATQLEHSCGEFKHRGEELPEGFAPVLGDRIHKALVAAREGEEDEFEGVIALSLEGDARVMRVTDTETPFTGDEDGEGVFTQGLDSYWSNVTAAIYDVDAHRGNGEARAYVSAGLAAEIAMEGQTVTPVVHPVVDYDQFTTVYILPTLDGWKLWVSER